MELSEFSEELKALLEVQKIDINNTDIDKLYEYMNMLIEWNNKINLTAITEPKDIILKHFVDSLTIEKYIKDQSNIIDVGTGAGFPGIPVGIFKKDAEVLLMDALNKRINFLDEVCMNLKLNNIKTIHARAEELARNKQYREQFDYATSRAVAPLNVLIEYMLPFVKMNGMCVCMKGANVSEEVKASKKALQVLGGEIEKIDTFDLAGTGNNRSIVIIKKVHETPKQYPRKAGTPEKKPII